MECRLDQMNETGLKIFTLNVWGLKYVSRHREQRIELIGKHLAEHNYDVVFLQEVWVQSDFEYIRSLTKSKYKFAHMFKNASILGTSGLVVLVKWVPKVFHFHPFSVNGSPFRPLHGDWFTSKGIGYVRIQLDAINLHLFCTHMHAQYNLDELLSDQYSVHRICQSYEMSKFVTLMTDSHSRSSNAKDFVILAGDMNASSREFPYRLLVSLTQLSDCYKVRTNSTKQINGVEGGDGFRDGLDKRIQTLTNEIESDMSDDEHHTCGHRDNTFTPKIDLAKQSSAGKRIDFILFRLFDRTNNSIDGPINHSLVKKLCEVKHETIQCKDESGLSFSDHQPVVAIFKIKCSDQKSTSRRIEGSDNESNPDLSSDKNISKDESVSFTSGNERTNYLHSRFSVNGGGSSGDKRMHGLSGDGVHNNQSSEKSENIGLLFDKPKLKLNIFSEVTEPPKTRPLQLKHMASNSVYSKLQSLSPNREQYLEITKHLLEDYINENQLTSKTFALVLIFFLFFLSSIVSSLCLFTQMTKLGIFFSAFLLSVVFFLSTFLKLMSSRHEKNAIKAILNDIEKELLNRRFSF